MSRSRRPGISPATRWDAEQRCGRTNERVNGGTPACAGVPPFRRSPARLTRQPCRSYISPMASAGEKALHAALKTRAFEPVYFFHGEDDYLKDARTRDLVEAAVDPATRDFNLELCRGSELDAETLDALLGTPPMLADRRVVVIRDVDKLKKDARALLLRYLDHPARDTVLVLVAPAGAKADKPLSDRTAAVEFAPLTGDRLPKWVAYHAETTLGRAI